MRNLFLPAALAASLFLVTPSYSADDKLPPSEHSQHDYSEENNKGNWESQYVTNDTQIGNDHSYLITHRNDQGRKDGLVEYVEGNGHSSKFTSAYRLPWQRFEFKGFLGSKDLDNVSLGSLENSDIFGGVHARYTHPISSSIDIRGEIGYERSLEKEEEINAATGYGKLRIEKKLPIDVEIMGGAGRVLDPEGKKTPYGFQVIVGKHNYGLGVGLTETDDETNSTTENLALFRHASYDPRENKYPTFFFFSRDNPEKSLKLLGIYHGPGIDGSWQLVRPAVYGIAHGMVERTWAHPDADLGRVARFTDVGSFSRDNEDGTLVVIGADFEQDIGNGLKVAARELDLFYTVYKDLDIISNPYIGAAVSQATVPSFNTQIYTLENVTAEDYHLKLGFNVFGKLMKERGLRLGIFSDIGFTDDGLDNACGIYLNGIDPSKILQ